MGIFDMFVNDSQESGRSRKNGRRRYEREHVRTRSTITRGMISFR